MRRNMLGCSISRRIVNGQPQNHSRASCSGEAPHFLDEREIMKATLFRVAHVHRPNPEAPLAQNRGIATEKVAFVAAASEAAAAAYVHALDKGHEVTGVTVEKKEVHVAFQPTAFGAGNTAP